MCHGLLRVTELHHEQRQAMAANCNSATPADDVADTVHGMCGEVLQHKAQMNVALSSAATGNKRRIAA